MEYFVEFDDDVILIRRSVRDGDLVGDAVREVRPGGSFYYLSYDDLRAQGEGSFELDEERLPPQSSSPPPPPPGAGDTSDSGGES